MASFQGLQPPMRQRAIALVRGLRAAGWSVTVTSGYRSQAAQARLWAQRARNKYPVAPPGCSWHQRGYAIDLVTDYPDLEGAAAEFGLYWAGPRDPVHFQLPPIGSQPC